MFTNQYLYIYIPFIFIVEISCSSFSKTIEDIKTGKSKLRASGNKVAPSMFKRFSICWFDDNTVGILCTAETTHKSPLIYLMNDLVTWSNNLSIPSVTYKVIDLEPGTYFPFVIPFNLE